MPSVRYLYARDASGSVVSVDALPGERTEWHEPFLCLGCERAVVAKRGEIVAKHFAHKPGTTCAPETYLHRLGKEVFRETFLACQVEGVPFEVSYAHPRVCRKHQSVLRRRCDLGAVARTFDLTRYYDAVAVEVRDGAFVPDLLLSSTAHPERKLYVEIAVTHFLSEEKRASGERIIEIAVESEADVERIRSRHLTEAEASFVGFHREPIHVVDAECACSGRTMHALFVYASGKSVLKQATLAELAAWRKRLADRIVYARLYETPVDESDSDVSSYGRGYVDAGRLYIELLLEARERGHALRNCFLCRYGGQSWDSFSGKGAFCKIARQSCNSNDAVECDKWRVQDALPPSDPDRARSLW